MTLHQVLNEGLGQPWLALEKLRPGCVEGIGALSDELGARANCQPL